MFDQRQSGYILPEGFTVISEVFERVMDGKAVKASGWLGRRSIYS